MDSESSEPKKTLPMDVLTIAGVHPAVQSPKDLLEQCELRTQRRSGPGGQHRNKTSSGVFLIHRPSQIVGEATERRSQADNRRIALKRLRFRLAIEIRSQPKLDTPTDPIEASLRDRYRQILKRMNDNNEDKPAVLALLLNDLYTAGGQTRFVAKEWGTSTTSLVNFVRSVPAAFAWLNRLRDHQGMKPLK
ncbi:Peptide chain release factor 1 [Novipirellula aureliae]|uniref:Peptide chain release factor 1 n=1 Tax=Novipirellula aureliae TaxID=2527966 RepID=A0A5C6E8X6_9BACT|nr:peptide chain release factor-like protein [Novipirellula aureliae]TWU43916.1 Peptide chain release factor 1 [Novipirellula aureliae]